MKRLFVIAAALLTSISLMAETRTWPSSNGRLALTVSDDGGIATYSVEYDGVQVMAPSRLGFEADFGDFTKDLKMGDSKMEFRDVTFYAVPPYLKKSEIKKNAERFTVTFTNARKQQMKVVFQITNNSVAYCYEIPRPGENPKCAVIRREVSSFNFPEGTSTFLCPQIGPMTGWERTKPSYEEDYKADAPMTDRSRFGQGYTFPCLFRVPVTFDGKGGKKGKSADTFNAWVLVSEVGVDGSYVGSHLSDYQPETGYTIAFPQAGENNGNGTPFAGIPLPYTTPWRTIVVGASLKPIVEDMTGIGLVSPKYKPSQEYKPGRYTWSWLVWQDESINYDDQVQFIDLAAAMNFEYCLVDNWWDQRIGRDRIEELSKYAQSKGVSLMLWYNSNGYENDAPQTPRDCLSTAIARDKEMAWLQKIGVKGIKVDFFGGDKQPTMQLYEDILYDANRYGLQVIFHGCTMPRGWELMYPNYVASEAVLASENVFFSEGHAKGEAFELCLHPFIRNAAGPMDWGGTIMNKYLSRDNKSRHCRYTTDIFEMAVAIVTQTPIQCIAIQPNNLKELPQFEIDFLKKVPTTWDNTRFLDGYPGKYVVLARRHGDNWYVAGLNAESEAKTLTIEMPEWKGQTIDYYVDDAKKESQLRQLKVDKKGKATITMQPNGGVILTKTAPEISERATLVTPNMKLKTR
ncbi:MAG: glycoside hydrolase family 97 catalytic domain-containing protein [Prevotella sp.]|nr:glycoside hydrolase family 97 catalytic domain-containing protein [Prevotella sp.]